MPELFVVHKPCGPQKPIEKAEPESLQVTGDTLADLQTALRALAFLTEWWLLTKGPGGLWECASIVQAWRQEAAQCPK